MLPTSQTVVNEVDRFLVMTPADATWYHSEGYIAIVFDDSPSGVIPGLLLEPGRRLNYAPAHEVFSRLCDDRAQRVVDQALLLDGKPVTPERYLAAWRKAIAQASGFEQLLLLHGLTIHAVLKGNLEAMRRCTTCLCDAPFESFAQLESTYADRFRYDDRGGFEVALDLREPGAARDAWYAADMAPYGPPDVMTATLAITGQLRRQSSSDLFGISDTRVEA